MKQPPIVSVVMITYGHEQFIEQAINSVLMQECDFEIELILANDCSPDQTDVVIQKIIQTHPKASIISYYKQEVNMGMMPNFIFALQKAEGKYIALCDGDDYWTDKFKLQKQVDFLNSNLDYVLCFHSVAILKNDGSMVEDFITSLPPEYETIDTLAKLGNYIHTPSVVYRNVLEETPPEFELSPIGDYFLYMMLAEHGKLKFLQDQMSTYRYGVGLFSGTTHSIRLQKEVIMLACLLSYLKVGDFKKILLDRYILLVDEFKKSIEDKNKENLPIRPFLQRAIEYVKGNYKDPGKILNKVCFKVLNKVWTK
ncbi:hypothetical protein FFWV33_07835 [Flavobacterium faecale]|uniref:Glycosyltransferase 2-like domain-containing protein n=1 Tax=Flavobacterium faecale TaxID=1355330 RepID=A0A2S1LCG7_9FLAO|nr:glycosyltransferase family 2 protein [Flavobacterium faecale]AWG21449.1 hypothetical protein FFWV33_07835 [Flavobacterium faecale]